MKNSSAVIVDAKDYSRFSVKLYYILPPNEKKKKTHLYVHIMYDREVVGRKNCNNVHVHADEHVNKLEEILILL